MFPFWETVIAPLIEASRARRVVEIGALRGDTTVRMVADLGPEAEVHVIDPVPQFDPTEHERAFPGQYVFHRDLSLNVLPDLPAVDVALIDGDHNWYTVYNELRLLREASRAADAPLPLLILHDVAWPYGYRDLYYEPSQIPEEFRQPYAKAGIHPRIKKLSPIEGINRGLDNAVESGGPRNGVRKALEDFLEEHDRPFRQVVLPFYFGLAIVAEDARIEQAPAVGEMLDGLVSSEGRLRLLHLSERIRIDAVVHEHKMLRVHNEALNRRTDRALGLLKDALLDLHYIENEVRLEYLASLGGAAPDLDALRDPARRLPLRTDRLRNARIKGQRADEARNLSYFPFADMGRAQLDHLHRALEDVTRAREQGDGIAPIEGDVAECGVGRGGGAVFMRGFLAHHEIYDRQVWVIDEFVATEPGADTGPDLTTAVGTFRGDLNQVRDAFHRFELLDDDVRFVAGRVPDALGDAPVGPLAVLRVGGSHLGSDLEPALERLLPKVVPGGRVMVEGTSRPAVEKVVAAVRDRLGVTAPLEQIDWNSVGWTVPLTADPVAAVGPSSSTGTDRVAVPERTDADLIDLTVVVVLYNMRREAARTLRTLTRDYQQELGDADYEVIVVDNGSADDQRLSADEVAAFGPEFRLVTMGEAATSSPTPALNRGIAESRGRAIALMIDGAHLLTPGVLGQSLLALRTYEPAIVAVQQWYVGPGQQGDAQLNGYDQRAEDALFRRIQWPVDGYRLFEISHFIGDRDWFDGMVESNCLVVPRSLLEQVGGFDDTFSTPGGGYANLELFERLGQMPGVTVVSLLGEGSFHQVHGGTTTNIADAASRRGVVFGYGEDFRRIRGRSLDGITSPIVYMGSMATKAARRTRSRRELSLSFDAGRDPVTHAPDDDTPTFVADELKIGAIEAVWGSATWREATWLGRPVARYPADLHVYQQLIAEQRPDVVVVVGDDEALAGRASFVASVLDGLGDGRVVAVGVHAAAAPAHPRLTAVALPGDAPEAGARVTELVGGGSALVLLGLGANTRLLAAFESLAPLVPVDGYVVIENTVVNGRPVASSFGPGPHEAVVTLLASHPDFVSDPTRERYTLTFNRGGYLKRLPPS